MFELKCPLLNFTAPGTLHFNVSIFNMGFIRYLFKLTDAVERVCLNVSLKKYILVIHFKATSSVSKCNLQRYFF